MTNIVKITHSIISVLLVSLTASVMAQGLSISDKDLSEYKSSGKTVEEEKSPIKKVTVQEAKASDKQPLQQSDQQKTAPGGALVLDDKALSNFTGEKREWPVEGMPDRKPEKTKTEMISGEDLIQFGAGASGMQNVKHEPAISDEAWKKYVKENTVALEKSDQEIQKLRELKTQRLQEVQVREKEIQSQIDENNKEIKRCREDNDREKMKTLEQKNQALYNQVKALRAYAHELKFLNISNFGDAKFDFSQIEKTLNKSLP